MDTSDNNSSIIILYMTDSLIEAKLKEWTGAKDPLAARIAVFENIRDIPYALIPELRDPVIGPAGLLRLNKGSCIPKHFLLGSLFTRIGIPVNYVSYLFYWDDKQVQYPPALRELTKKIPMGAHLACKAYIDEKWVLVDATWDPALRNYGFPVNEKWDGFSDCRNAVTPIKEIIHKDIEERVRYSLERRKLHTEEEKKIYEVFTAQVNDWLEMIRSGAGV